MKLKHSVRKSRVVLLLVPIVGIALWAGSATAVPTGQSPQMSGRELFLTGCSSCHGTEGLGARTSAGELRGPSLRDAGEAAAFYQLSTGRMPLAASGDRPTRKDPSYDDAQIAALVDYVGSLGNGPAIPKVDDASGDLAVGGVLFRQSCQACHSATGAGGALSYGRAAPSLHEATALQIATAMRSGPGQMPVFDERALSSDDVDSIARYVRYLRDPQDRGGLALGRLGPIPEGFLIWVFGLGVLLVICVWIGRRNQDRHALPSNHE